MALTWINARFPGKCNGCNADYDTGARIQVDIKDKLDAQGKPVLKDGKPERIFSKPSKCPACDGKVDTQQRREDDAVRRSNLPRDIAEMTEKCGTLKDALELLVNFKEMDASLKSTGRSFKDLALAAVNACLNSSMLPTCEPASWVSALQAAAAMGIIPDPGMGGAALAYFIPRGGKVSLDLSYRGLCNLAFNSRQVVGHTEEVVWECEVVLGEIVSLLRSSHAYEREAGEAMRRQLIEAPDQTLSAWDRGVIAEALARPDGLVMPWFRYQESPQAILHRRPRWFKPPVWDEAMNTLPWGVYVDVKLIQGGRAITVLTRDQCYERASRGGNVKLYVNENGDKRARLKPGTTWGKWATTPWLRDQGEMMKKTAIRDVLTGGKVPISPRMQAGLAAEIIDAEFTQIANPATSLDQHLRTIAGGQRVPDAYQIEDQGEAPDYAAEAERLNQREPVPVGSSVEGLRELMRTAPDAAVMDAYDAAGVPSGVPVEEFNAQQREAFLKALRGGA